MPGSRALRFFGELRREIREDNIATGAAALAFYWMLSLFPAAIFLLTLLAYLPIAANLDAMVMDFIREALPDEAASLVSGVVDSVLSHRRGGLLSFGIILTLWSTSSGTHAVMQQLNVAYDVEEHRPFWKTRLTALLLTVIFFVLVIGGLLLILFGGFVQRYAADVAGWNHAVVVLVTVGRYVVVVISLLLALALTYYLGPHVRDRFRLVSPGNVTGVTLLVLASVGFHFFVAHLHNFDVTYGSLGAVITLMLWLYLAGWAILLGGEIDATLRGYRSGGGGTSAGDV